MTRFSVIDLSQLPPPEVIKTLDVEAIITEAKAQYAALYPEFTADLESEPLVKLMEANAVREMNIRAQVNDEARAVLLAFAQGNNLDHLGANFSVARRQIDPGDADATPPIPATYEDDPTFLRRIQLSPEALSVAGSRGGYIFNALSAGETPLSMDVESTEPGKLVVTYEFPEEGFSALIKDADAYKTQAGSLDVIIMGWEGSGVPNAQTLQTVEAYLSGDYVRPMCDGPTIRPVEPITYSLDITLEVQDGPEAPIILSAAQAAVEAYTLAQHKIGRRITASSLDAAATVSGVEKVRLSGFVDIEPARHQTAYCTGITMVVEVLDD
ncbi:MAG: baseplate J/gp47 family protein [Parvibaculaceae bacterium]|nr:baseplate J/gp47 family protein [Parvibaculaceae bacterium]